MSGSNKPVQGVMRAEQLDPDIFRGDLRTPYKKAVEWLSQPTNMVITLFMISGGAWYYPALAQFVVPSMIPFVFWGLRRSENAPIKMPVQSGMLDPNERNPGNDKAMKAQGIFCIGNNLVDGKEIWLTNDDCRQHFLVLGTTGAGKAASADSLVHTPEGFRRLGDIRVDDLVSCPVTGGSSPVTGVFPQGLREMWKITFEDNRTVDVDPEHLWEVDAGEVITTVELASRIADNKRVSIPLSAALETSGLDWDAAVPGADYGRLLALPHSRETTKSAEACADLIRTRILPASLNTRKGFLQAVIAQAGKTMPLNTIGVPVRLDARGYREMQELAWSLGFKATLVQHNGGCFLEISGGYNEYSETTIRLRVKSVKPLPNKTQAICIMVDHPRHLYVMDNYIVTHNTELLIGFAANAVSWGSGLLYCDGKGDVSLFAKMYALCRKFGREDDLLVLNFMNGNKDDNTGGGVRSNTLNPFSTGASDGLTQMIVGLMPEVGGDGAMWKGRAVAMLTGVIKALVWLREKGNLDLNVGTIREFMGLKNIISLASDKDYPELPKDIRTSVRAYLTSLPGYVESKGIQQAQTTLDQHGYLEMQFSQIFGSLNDVYGHIFKSAYGQIDMSDVVLNRRILVIMLPALEKSQDELSNLGKIVVANLKGMMGGTLGANLEGSWEDVVERRPTTAPSPFMCILDEVGYYTVDGMALMAAQARSLGFSMVYASQDIPAMQRNNEKEAASIIANTNTKIFMRTEEADKTGDLAVKSGGEVHRAQLADMERHDGELSSRFRGSKNVRFEKSNRVTFLDLKSQGPGELTITYKGEVVRGKAFYAEPSSSLDKGNIKLRANHFIEVARPNQSVLTKEAESVACMSLMIDKGQEEAMALAVKEAMENLDAHAADNDETCMIAQNLSKAMMVAPDMVTSACCALARLASLTGATVQKTNKNLSMRTNSRGRRDGDDYEGDIIPQDVDALERESQSPYMDDEPVGPRVKARSDASVRHAVSVDNKRVWGPEKGVSNSRELLKCLAELDFDDTAPPSSQELSGLLDEHLGSSPKDTARISSLAAKAQEFEDAALDIGAVLPPENLEMLGQPQQQPEKASVRSKPHQPALKPAKPVASASTSTGTPVGDSTKPAAAGKAKQADDEGEGGSGEGGGEGNQLIEDFISGLLSGEGRN